jgi:hypothetical protein
MSELAEKLESETALINPSLRALDGFDGGDDDGGRDDEGARIKFTNEAKWTVNDVVLSPTLELVAVNVDRYVIYWKPDGTGPDREKSYYLKIGQKWPDIQQMNKDTLQDQWRESFGKLVGPWAAQHIVRLLDPVSMDRYSFPTSTDGGQVAVRELRQRTRDMRRVRGEHVFALVRLRDTFFPTSYGGRQRPHFEIVRFVTFGDDGTVKSGVLPSSETSSLAGPSIPSTASIDSQMKTVEMPSAKEVTGDEILF